nr:NAD-dependent epimerase/dehydratase family protein [bacterium]
ESPYAESKWKGEQLIAQMESADGVSLRFFNVFGQRQDPNSQYAAVVSVFQDALRNNCTPIIFGDGNQTRDFTPVQNVVHAMLLAGACPRPLHGEVFNVGTGTSLSLNELLQAMAHDENVQAVHEEPRVGDVQHSQADITLITEVLGYSSIIETRQALADLVNPRR